MVTFEDEVEHLQQQLNAFRLFRARLQEVEGEASLSHLNREHRMDASRALSVLRRADEALRHRLESPDTTDWASADSVRVIVANQHPWYCDNLTEALHRRGATVLATLSNGADALGLALAENPTLVFVDFRLEMLPGLDLVRALRRYLPLTQLVATTPEAGEAAAMLEAGALAVYTRQIPPAQAADEALALLDSHPLFAAAAAPKNSAGEDEGLHEGEPLDRVRFGADLRSQELRSGEAGDPDPLGGGQRAGTSS